MPKKNNEGEGQNEFLNRSRESEETVNEEEITGIAKAKAAQINSVLVNKFIPPNLKDLLEQFDEVNFTEQLHEGSLRKEARDRLRQGVFLLKAATQEDDFVDAVAVLKKGTKSDSTFVPLLFCLGIGLERLENYEEACKYYSWVSRLSNDSEKRLAALSLARIAFIQQKLHNFPEALQNLQTAVAKDPENLEISFALAKILYLIGLQTEATSRLLELIQKDKSFAKRIVFDSTFPDTLVRQLVDLLQK